ncbi:hypothetical protein [uncultured Sphingomonas sp.]|uniref:hypothetical protein n=1 Tax=uncultured Sphingomonas sp. TaxID=158754 RepID=UPI0035CB6038
MNPFPADTAEWLAHEARAHADGSTSDATTRLVGAIEVLRRWQLMAAFCEPEDADANG